jgi:hypothetical protein
MLEQTDPDDPDRGVVLRAHEQIDGRRVGQLELGVFSADLIIDRDGVLEELVTSTAALVLAGPAAGRLLVAGSVAFAAGASGHRMDVVLSSDEQGQPRPACPYVTWLALGSDDLALRGGVFATIHSAGPSWDAATRMLDSLRISGLGGNRAAAATRLALPLVRGR